MADSSRPRYSPEERAQVLVRLHVNAGNVKRTARECGVSPQTVRRYRESAPGDMSATDTATAERSALEEIQHLKRLYAVRAADAGAINQTTGWYAVQAYQRLTELEQLLTGRPTQRIEASPWGQLLQEIRDKRGLRVLPGGKAAEGA